MIHPQPMSMILGSALFFAFLGVGCSSGPQPVENEPPRSEIPSITLTQQEYDRMMDMGPAEAIKRYGPTIRGYLCQDCEFLLSENEHPFRRELVDNLSGRGMDPRVNGVRILEMTWPVDQFRNLTIWYRRTRFRDAPVHLMVWNRYWNFDAVLEDSQER